MKAFLLAAGYGTRLRPITNTVPKCMVKIHGQPLLGWWLALMRRHGITDVMINTHYLRDQVNGFIQEYNQKHTGLTIHEAYEQELLGSAGTIRNNKDFVRGEESFLVCYADNLTDVNLTAFYDFHCEHKGILSMALFHTNIPHQCGIAEVNESNLITRFEEKPEHPQSDLANAGMYIAHIELLEYLDRDTIFLDFGKDVLPKLIGKMYGWLTEGYIIDIGTVENYIRANEEWPYDHYKDTAEDKFCWRWN